MIKYLLPILLMCSCTTMGYKGSFTNLTNYSTKTAYKTSPSGIKVYTNGNTINLNDIDLQVLELEQCLSMSIRRDWFSVYIPKDWYWSNPVCTADPQQLIPSTVDYKLCEAKGLVIKKECRYLKYPTAECPCVCNVRSTIQNNNVVVTTPNLKLFKMSLARIILWPKYVLDNKDYTKCLW